MAGLLKLLSRKSDSQPASKPGLLRRMGTSAWKGTKSGVSNTSKWAYKNSGIDKSPLLKAGGDKLLSLFQRRESAEKNKEANERALAASGLNQPQVDGAGGGLSPQAEEDIHQMRKLMEEQKSKTEGSVLGDFGKAIGEALKGRMGGLGKAAGRVLGGVGTRLSTVAIGGAAAAGAGLKALASKGMDSLVDAGTSLKGAVGAKAGTLVEQGKGLATTAKEGAKGTGAAISKTLGKTGLKSLVKKIPGIGLLAGLGFGLQRALAGDLAGAGLEVASGVAGTIPGVGTAASLGIDAGLAARDAGLIGTGTEKGASEAVAQQAVYRTKTEAEDPVNKGIKNLQDFVGAALDENGGIYVKIVKDELRDEPLLQRQEGQRPAQGQPQAQGPKPTATPQPSGVEPTSYTPSPKAAAEGQALYQRINRQAGGLGSDAPTLQRKPVADSAGRIAPTTDLASSDLGNLISRGEGDYDSYNSGTKGVAGGKVGFSGKKDLSGMTLNEIIESSESKNGNDKDRVFAAGRYQVITPTMKAAMKQMGLKGDEKFTPELQDKMFEHLMPKAAKDYLSGKSNDIESAQLALAKEWRSVADPTTGKTYADAGASANKASISTKEIQAALQKTREKNMAELAKKPEGKSDQPSVMMASAQATTPAVSAASNTKMKLDQPESNLSGQVRQVSMEVEESRKASAAPIVVQAPAQQAQGKIGGTSGGPAGVGGHLNTRNDDTAIKAVTIARMSHSV